MSLQEYLNNLNNKLLNHKEITISDLDYIDKHKNNLLHYFFENNNYKLLQLFFNYQYDNDTFNHIQILLDSENRQNETPECYLNNYNYDLLCNSILSIKLDNLFEELSLNNNINLINNEYYEDFK